jgi:hypothetical protein
MEMHLHNDANALHIYANALHHEQQTFSDLEIKSNEIDMFACDSVSSSFCGSLTDSFDSLATRSVTTVLSSALASGLTLKGHAKNENPKNTSESSFCAVMNVKNLVLERTAASKASKLDIPNLPDFEWLHERCDGDTQLALEVLRCFCEQGQTHVQAMQIAMKEMDMSKLAFHAVKSLKPNYTMVFPI